MTRAGRSGAGVEEKGRDANGKVRVAVDPRYFRPTEVQTLLGDASKAERLLQWKSSTSFQALVEEMALADMKIAERDALVRQHGYTALNFHQ